MTSRLAPSGAAAALILALDQGWSVESVTPGTDAYGRDSAGPRWFPELLPQGAEQRATNVGASPQVRRRSKACRAGLKQDDQLVAIGHRSCAELSHADAMSLIDSESATLSLRVRRSEKARTRLSTRRASSQLLTGSAGFQGSSRVPPLASACPGSLRSCFSLPPRRRHGPRGRALGRHLSS